MNRRQKIIVSVTGIFLVLLLLVGLTYAYFLTRITGNTNTKSISVTTANLALVYGDGNGIITAEQIQPGTTLDTKTFTVKNEGNATSDYVVLIEDVKVTYAEDVNDQEAGATTTFVSNDFVYTLTCTSDGAACNGITTETTFPINGGILVGNSIEVGKTHSYELTVTYKDIGADQSNDMNKSLEAKINIADPNSYNPYNVNKGSLAYNIINNALMLSEEEKTNGYATYATIPMTKVAQEISGENESVLSITQDDYGTSYYYRGAVKNNYLTFNNMCWRIVRIEGDGAIKIVLADKDAGCSEDTLSKTDSAFIGTGDYGYTKDESTGMYFANYENSDDIEASMKYKFDKFLNGGNITDSNGDTITFTAWSAETLEKLKTTQVCIGDITTKYDDSGNILTDEEATELDVWYYDSHVRLYGRGQTANATLLCNENASKTSKTKIYPLTADEIVFAGLSINGNYKFNYNYYLIDNAITESGGSGWWSLSPAYYCSEVGGDCIFNVMTSKSYNDSLEGHVLDDYRIGYWSDVKLRPAVSLIKGTQIASGDGSISNPYTIQ